MSNEFVDTSDFERGLRDYERKFKAAGEAALAKAGLHLLGVATQDAPVKEGTLRGSGSVIVNGKSIATSAGSGKGGTPASTDSERGVVVGFNVPYAAKQDQDPNLHHPKGGKAGYLSENFNSNWKLYRKWYKDAISGIK